jgi:drug/metabolite transporter (DMT)-like permease
MQPELNTPNPSPAGANLAMKNSAHAPTMGAREWVLLLVLSVLWGCSFFFYKILVAELPPLTLVLGRVGLAALLLNIFLMANAQPLPRAPRLWGAFIAMGLLNNVIPFTLIAWGETRISSGLASILNATTPVFTVLFAHCATVNERLNWNKGVGALLGFLGVGVLVGPSALAGFGVGRTSGALACLAAAFSYAIAGVFARRFKEIPPLHVATGQLTGSTLLLIPLACLIDQPWSLQAPSVHAWEALAGIAVLSTALAYILYFRLLATAGATNVLLVTLLLPISALVLGAAFLGETISAEAVAGMALIGSGLASIDGRVPAAIRKFLKQTFGWPKPPAVRFDPD